MAARRILLAAATLLAFAVVGLGAWVRLSDAGLACPDWPGCYGQLLGVPESAEERRLASADFPASPVEPAKAWKEMSHRYLAGSLGLLILLLTVSAWRMRNVSTRSPWAETALLALVAIQALLGMATVTLLLKPVVVTLHLLGGMTTLGLLVGLSAREWLPARPADARLRAWAGAALAVIAIQIALGGWVSSHSAGLACPDFPACRGAWLPADAPGAIQMAHRLGAAWVLVIVGGLAAALWRRPAWRSWGSVLALLLALQLGLGIANVLSGLPLPLAVAHNLGAALLLAAMVAVVAVAASAGQRRQQLGVHAAEAAVAHDQNVVALPRRRRHG